MTKRLLVKMLSLKKQLTFLTPSSLGRCERRLPKMRSFIRVKASGKVERACLPGAFCFCKDNEDDGGKRLSCSCGEELNVHEWVWDNSALSSASQLFLEGREVRFHPCYSCGTAAVRGSRPCVGGNIYYWEIKVLTPLFGTDVMIGVGTDKVDLEASQFHFCSLLGSDEESWGYSYNGSIQHEGKMQAYGPSYSQGSIVGVYLDMWKGTLEFYLNRKPLGVAFTSLQGRTLYPMLCSTAARSAMKVIYSSSSPSTLKLLCLKSVSTNSDMMKILKTVPFLRNQIERYYWWLVLSKGSENCSEYCEMEATDDDPRNEVEYYSDEDEDASLASFCASLSGASNSSSQETSIMKRDTRDKKKIIPIRHGQRMEPARLCSQCDTHRSAVGTFSTRSKKLCIVCDVII
ncbi:SPRY domain-containing SOCS box protein 3 isoform X2 [Zootermopsis nevadensis]|uniref:SPRY domain-containing SOCS box protein 3 isoform X2 n=1 Tax=Zootermopsis nevadensis TaxID=136037 RepID=UPI000B8E7856|nr:SPRY domain-containing SOCS box protein 3 isoform X2 [Zootermopsis nevadensis]